MLKHVVEIGNKGFSSKLEFVGIHFSFYNKDYHPNNLRKAMIVYIELSIILHLGYDSLIAQVHNHPKSHLFFSFSFIARVVIRDSFCFVFI